MDIEKLELFLAVVEAGTVTAAAKKVHLTQPAVSRNIQQLEQDLGVPLFDRGSRRMTLTAAGRALHARATGLLDVVRRTERETRRAAERAFFDLRVGTVDSVATYLFPDVVGPLRSAFPELEIKLFTDRTRALLDRLEQGELDAVIAAYSGAPPFADVYRIGTYDLQFYGRSDLFPTLAEVTTERELQEFPIVQLSPLPGQPTLITNETTSFALATSLATIKSLVLGGFGVGSLLSFTLTEAERQRLVRAQVPHDPDCALYLITSPDWSGQTETEITTTLVDALVGAYPDR
jgi:DNA-binding transcriptional LysR family regulator